MGTPTDKHECDGQGQGHGNGDCDGHGHGHGACQSRRRFCELAIGGAAVISIGAVTYPIVSFTGLPKRIGESKPVEIPMDRLVPGQAHYVQFQGLQLIVLMTEEGPQVLNASCPHLGCNVVWETAHSVFHCPCHGAVFNDQGHVVSGPVSSPLRPVPFEIRDGILIIA